MKENQAGPGKFVEYSYKLYDDATGDVLFETPADQPDFMVFGVSHEIVPGLVAAIEGLSAGDRFETTLPPAAAFGERNPEYEMELDADIFMRDGALAPEVKPGAVLPMMTAEGYRVMGTVLAVSDKKVKMDFNHPFAGKTVTYKGEVVAVRDATPEELHPAKGGCGGCGGGCCGDGDGSCGDGCGDGCGSGDGHCCH